METTQVTNDPAIEETAMNQSTSATLKPPAPDQSKIRAALRSNLLYGHYLEPLIGQRPPSR
jgi:hypothetical protein